MIRFRVLYAPSYNCIIFKGKECAHKSLDNAICKSIKIIRATRTLIKFKILQQTTDTQILNDSPSRISHDVYVWDLPK